MLLVDFHRMLLTHALLALSADQFFNARKKTYEHVHSVRIELAKLILVGTKMTYQATGDAGNLHYCRLLYGTHQRYVKTTVRYDLTLTASRGDTTVLSPWFHEHTAL